MNRLRRVHIGTVVGIMVAFYIGFYLIKTVQTNYLLQRQITDLNGKISQLQSDKAELGYKIQYYQTDAYKEKEARSKLGLQAPGESVIILPHKDESSKKPVETKSIPRKTNFQQWVDFILGRS